MLDGVTLVRILHLPLHLRKEIAAETQVYTLAEPLSSFFVSG